MCLHTTSGISETSSYDVECWKVFAVVKHLKSGMVWRTSPHTDYIVPDNVINGLMPMESNDPWVLEVREKEIMATHSVSNGFIHSYAGKVCAQILMKTEYTKWLEMLSRCNYKYELDIPGCITHEDSMVEILGYELYQCVIPKGTPYYSGLVNPDSQGSTLGYASRKILVKEREDTVLVEKKKKTWPMPYGAYIE